MERLKLGSCYVLTNVNELGFRAEKSGPVRKRRLVVGVEVVGR